MCFVLPICQKTNQVKFKSILFKNGPTPAYFFIYFRSFLTNNTIFTTNQCEKMSKCTSSIWHRDLNPQPFEHESSPITTRRGLPPFKCILIQPKSFLAIADLSLKNALALD